MRRDKIARCRIRSSAALWPGRVESGQEELARPPAALLSPDKPDGTLAERMARDDTRVAGVFAGPRQSGKPKMVIASITRARPTKPATAARFLLREAMIIASTA